VHGCRGRGGLIDSAATSPTFEDENWGHGSEEEEVVAGDRRGSVAELEGAEAHLLEVVAVRERLALAVEDLVFGGTTATDDVRFWKRKEMIIIERDWTWSKDNTIFLVYDLHFRASSKSQNPKKSFKVIESTKPNCDWFLFGPVQLWT
jgi:hypothetical protein